MRAAERASASAGRDLKTGGSAVASWWARRSRRAGSSTGQHVLGSSIRAYGDDRERPLVCMTGAPRGLGRGCPLLGTTARARASGRGGSSSSCRNREGECRAMATGGRDGGREAVGLLRMPRGRGRCGVAGMGRGRGGDVLEGNTAFHLLASKDGLIVPVNEYANVAVGVGSHDGQSLATASSCLPWGGVTLYGVRYFAPAAVRLGPEGMDSKTRWPRQAMSEGRRPRGAQGSILLAETGSGSSWQASRAG